MLCSIMLCYVCIYAILYWYKSTHRVSQFQTSIHMVLAQGQKVKGIDLLDQQYVTTDEEQTSHAH